jgi:biopolymer transport protein ExbB
MASSASGALRRLDRSDAAGPARRSNQTEDGGFTFSAWIKLDAMPTTATLIYGHRQDGKAVDRHRRWCALREVDGDKPQRSTAGQPI